MSIKLWGGSLNVKDIQVGNKTIKEVYNGDDLVYGEKYFKITCVKTDNYATIKFKMEKPNRQQIINDPSWLDLKYSYDKKIWNNLLIDNLVGDYYYSNDFRLNKNQSIFIKNNGVSPNFKTQEQFGNKGLQLEGDGVINNEFKFSGTIHCLYNFTQIYIKNTYEVLELNPIYFNNNSYITSTNHLFAGFNNKFDASDLNIDFKCDALNGKYYSIYAGYALDGTRGLFANSKIIYPPKFLRSIMYNNDYNNMFYGCSNLIKSPKIIGIQNENDSYQLGWMFYGCTSLVEGPHLHFTNGNIKTFLYHMFDGCTSLKSVKIDYTGDLYFEDWLNNVYPTGVLYYNGSDRTIGSSSIPSGWTVQTF